MKNASSEGPARFTDFFMEVHGVEPFPWQRRLLTDILEGRWPEIISLPTASGKTALIDVMLFALAIQADLVAAERTVPRRLFFVIDRRVVVDEVSERARRIAAALDQSTEGACRWVADRLRAISGERPLQTTTLRGGLYRDDQWVDNPAQALVCVTTVDQVGSRLLFRGYGLSDYQLPVHAGLTGNDALYVVDEAHLSTPLIETLHSVVAYRNRSSQAVAGLGGPLRVIEMSATPPPGTPSSVIFLLGKEDRQHPILKSRLSAKKLATLDECRELDEAGHEQFSSRLAEHALQLGNQKDVGVIGVIANRVATARATFERLKATGTAVALLTGRIREWDRDQILADVLPRMRAGRERVVSEKLYVVATQTIEVGANLDFDALVTEAAPIDALRQRFGRLDRLGQRRESRAVVVLRKRATRNKDPIYGDRLDSDWAWLKLHATGKGRTKSVDFGITALDKLLAAHPASKSPRKSAPVLLPAHVRLFSQTSPRPHPDPDVAPFLHGVQTSSTDVALVWRADLDAANEDRWLDIVAAYPPRTREILNVPIWAAQQWLGGLPAGDMSDLETVQDDVTSSPRNPTRAQRRVLCWLGPEDSRLVAPAELRPGDTLIIPSSWGGADMFGWNPLATQPVRDIAELVRIDSANGRKIPIRLRLQTEVLRHMLPLAEESILAALSEAIATYLRGLDDETAAGSAGSRLESVRAAWLGALQKDAPNGFPRNLLSLIPYPSDNPVGLLLGASIGEIFTDDDDTSSLTVPVPLLDHLEGVGHCIDRFSTWALVPPALRADLVLAGRLHDLGKAEFRFQVMLHGGDEMAAVLADGPLAKSGMDSTNRQALRRARELSQMPRGFRHEVFSVALIDSAPEVLAAAHDPDLVRYLIGAHHGRGRPFFSAIRDLAPEICELRIFDRTFKASSDTPVWHLGYGWTEIYWRLSDRYGAWGLAWLEAMVRLGDRRRSREEQQK